MMQLEGSELQEISEVFAKSIAREMEQFAYESKREMWCLPVEIDLSIARTTPEQLGDYPHGADTIIYLPDSTGFATIYLDNPNSHAYRMGVDYRKLRAYFRNIYVANSAQAGARMNLLVGQGDIDSGMVVDGTIPAPYNVTMLLPNVEYSQAFPANTKKFYIKTRDGSAFRVALEAGRVAAPTDPYTTVPARWVYWEDHIRPAALTIYFASALAGRVVEIGSWS